MKFLGSPEPTVGMELEWQLVDRDTLDLVSGILPLVRQFSDNPHVTPEFMQSAVEINSPICRNTAELRTEIQALLDAVIAVAKGLGMRLCGAGTHPFSERLADVTPLPRYRLVEENTGYVGYSQLTFAMHVHVGMPTGDDAMRVLCGLIPYLPALIAISANSPFYRGSDTAFASYRLRILALGSRYGTPPYIHNWRRFVQAFAAARRAGMYATISDAHWHLRPQPSFGTLEVRILDMQPTLAIASAVAAFVHSLAVLLLRHPSPETAGHLPQTLPWWLELENRYSASRYGLEAPFIYDERGRTRPLDELVHELIERVLPVARQLGNARDLERLRRWLDESPGYRYQRELYASTGSLRGVTEALCEAVEKENGSKVCFQDNDDSGPFHVSSSSK
ncbi:MAG: YbdK family carboxylate-amine ligase [Gammaproteobacteria bacterium]|jgi:carboxylate-amine ligase